MVNLILALKDRFLALTILVVAFVVYFYIQFSFQSLAGNDAFYHFKLAELFSESLFFDFPWLPNSVLSNDRYVDHHFLFHLFLVPFTFFDFPFGAKLAVVVCGFLTFLTFLFVLPRKSKLLLIIFSLLYFISSPAFLYRMSLLRAQSLSLVTLFLLFYFLKQRKWKTVFFVSFFYVWLYNAFPLIFLLSFSFFISSVILKDKEKFKYLFYPVFGLVVGLILNPFFPRNIVFLYHHLIDKFALRDYAVKVGGEWYPYSSHALFQNLSIPLILLCVSIFLMALKVPKKRESIALVLFTLFTFIMVLKSKRFTELFPIFSVLSFSYVLDEYSSEIRERFTHSLNFLSRGSYSVFFLILFFLSFHSVKICVSEVAKSKDINLFLDSSLWLKNNTKSGELVVSSSWDEFPRLFYYNDSNVYYWGLDPYFTYEKDPNLFHLWKLVTQGRYKGDVSWLMQYRLKSNYILVSKEKKKMLEILNKDVNLKKVFVGEDSLVYALNHN